MSAAANTKRPHPDAEKDRGKEEAEEAVVARPIKKAVPGAPLPRELCEQLLSLLYAPEVTFERISSTRGHAGWGCKFARYALRVRETLGNEFVLGVYLNRYTLEGSLMATPMGAGGWLCSGELEDLNLPLLARKAENTSAQVDLFYDPETQTIDVQRHTSSGRLLLHTFGPVTTEIFLKHLRREAERWRDCCRVDKKAFWQDFAPPAKKARR